MSWAQQLADELTARGVVGRERRRIVLELQDHIACEPSCEERLGDPRELAARFADEFATDGARRGAFAAFAALALAALALAVSQLAIAPAGGYPGFDHGRSLMLFIPAALGMFIAPQAALVAGTLAAWRALRRRRRRAVLPAAEVALIRRRASVGLGAGLATMAGLELYVLDFSAVLPLWWLALVGGLAGLAALALIAVLARLHRVGSLVASGEGPAGDVFQDLPFLRPRWLRASPWRLGAAASLTVGFAMTLFEWHAERSLFEGLQRGAFEGLAAAVGFVLLGRAIGVADAAAPKREGVR
jgi:hypothetical protein